VFSAQADPGSNTAFAQWARNSRYAGHPAEIARTGQQARTYNTARDAQEAYLRDELTPGRNSNPADPAQSLAARYFPAMRLGDKTDVYRQHMDASARAGSTGTNDIWHGRALGYVDAAGEPWDSAFSPGQHVWMDHETMQAVNRAIAAGLGGRNNWTPSEIQAAPWVSGKSESLQRRFGIDATEGDRRANATYPDYAHTITADMPHEQIPGGSTGLTTGSMTPEQWHAASRWAGPGGNDPGLLDLGMLNRRVTSGMGAWLEEGKNPTVEVNPVDIARPQVAYYTDEATDKRTFDPRTKAGLEAAAATRGLMDMQIGSPVTMWDTRAGSNKSTSVTIDLGRTTTANEARALDALARKHGLGFANRAEGAGFMNFDGAAKGRDVQKTLDAGLAAEIQKIVPGAKIGRADTGPTSGSVYADYGKKLREAVQGKGQATRQLDKTLTQSARVAPGYVTSLLDSPNIAAKARMNLDRLQKSGQTGVRPDYELFQRLVAEGRLRQALEWARANGYQGLPAAAGGAGLGAGLLGEGGSTGRGS
jgi:hypothetical protein